MYQNQVERKQEELERQGGEVEQLRRHLREVG